tara:strand:- start:972 stop:1373 length:402 start_codon:yes stop_codon:yes gene_type:complete
MPNYKRSGFKMKGYSYPGTSPMKGKKADKLAAADSMASAQEKSAEFDNMKMKSTDIMADKSFKVSPATKRAPLKNADIEDATKSFTKELGEQAGKAAVDAAIGLGANALSKGKKKKETKVADQSNFSNIKFGK